MPLHFGTSIVLHCSSEVVRYRIGLWWKYCGDKHGLERHCMWGWSYWYIYYSNICRQTFSGMYNSTIFTNIMTCWTFLSLLYLPTSNLSCLKTFWNCVRVQGGFWKEVESNTVNNRFRENIEKKRKNLTPTVLEYSNRTYKNHLVNRQCWWRKRKLSDFDEKLAAVIVELVILWFFQDSRGIKFVTLEVMGNTQREVVFGRWQRKYWFLCLICRSM